MDDFFPVLTLVVLVILSLPGILFIVDSITATTLDNTKWSCTEVTIDNGKPACIKYERAKKVTT